MLKNYLPFLPYPVEGTNEPCNLCGGKETLEICNLDRRLKPLRTVVCADCGLMRTQPMPTDEELAAYYAGAYRRDYQLASSTPPKAHIVSSMRTAHARMKDLSQWIKPGCRVLDFGCGSGEFAYLAKEAGCEVYAFDPGGDYLDFARITYSIDAQAMRWQDAEFPFGFFDVVSSYHVVEHLRKPVDAMKKMADWLSSDGVIHIEVPDMRANHKPAFDRFHFAHVHGFTPASLEAAGRVAGLVPVLGHLHTTSAVFQKLSNASEIRPIDVIDRQRARELKKQYPHDSPFIYALSGRWATQAVQRAGRWLNDTFA